MLLMVVGKLKKRDKYIEDNGYTFPVYFDMDLDATKVYEAYSLPTTVFIEKMAILLHTSLEH